MSLQNLVREAFQPEGLLSRTVAEFKSRPGQTDMAIAIARIIEDGGVLVVEAGTGIGKTFSYLVPALLSGTQVLLSTATKTLQDQLFSRDIPNLVMALGLPVRAALLKGRSSYLCLHRLDSARQNLKSSDQSLARTIAKIEEWVQVTRSGDLAELSGLDERSPVIPLITSTRDNCLGSPCPQFRRCHVNLARRDAMAADIVVINHHLFFADLAVRESGVAELLPTVQTVIFDEAHQINETGVQFLGRQLTTGQVFDFTRDLLSTGLQHARGLQDWLTLATNMECAARDLRMVVGQKPVGTKLRWATLAPEQMNELEWSDALNALHNACSCVSLALAKVNEVAPDFVRLTERVSLFIDRLESFSAHCDVDFVRWLDVGAQLTLVESPIDIAATFQTRIMKSDQDGESKRSWIFTSATLGDDPRLRWFTEQCGLDEAEVLTVESPFDYAAQAAIYVPLNLPKPSDSTHSAMVANFVAQISPVIGGRTLVLTTTLRALKIISEVLEKNFESTKTLEILVQGQRSKRELIERFRQGNSDGLSGCILIASASFWEGVDIPGDSLQLLVIDKLPFPPPNDPVVEARSRRHEDAGRSVFNSYYIPEVSIALKQGAGRLIRRESDHGVLVVCDTRLAQMGYGKRLMRALPPMRKLNSEAELFEALHVLTKTSTKDPNWF